MTGDKWRRKEVKRGGIRWKEKREGEIEKNVQDNQCIAALKYEMVEKDRMDEIMRWQRK